MVTEYVEVTGHARHVHLGCEDCGTIVFDTERHDAWHEAQEAVSNAASRADGRTRRIG